MKESGITSKVAGCDLAKRIDYAGLRKDISTTGIEKLCKEAVAFGFSSVTVCSMNIHCANEYLAGSPVIVSSVVGYPFGGQAMEVKSIEASLARERGAEELEICLNIAAVRAGNWDYVQREMELFREVSKGIVIKIIVESKYLDDKEKRTTWRFARETGIDYIVNSTDFRVVSTNPESAGKATVEEIRLMNEAVFPHTKIKAVGGIDTCDDIRRMLEAGAARVGIGEGSNVLRYFESIECQ